jgi:hypothetical protein
VAATRAGLADSGAVMARHVDAARSPLDLRRTAQLSGLTGGVLWVVAAFAGDGAAAGVLLWLGGLLLTVALAGLGLLLVKSDVVPLRVFVGLALPTLVWGVVALVRGSAVSASVVDVVFGGGIALLSATQLLRRREPRRTTL